MSYPVEENGIYYCKVRDRAGNIKQTSYSVTNVDVTPPKASYRTDGKWYGGKTTIIVTGEDLQPDGSPGCGLAEKAYSLDGITFDETLEIEVSREESIFVWIKDTLGNIGKNELAIKYDKKESGGSGCVSDGHGSQGDAPDSDTSKTGTTDRLQNPETVQEPAPLLPEPAIPIQETLLPRELLEELSKREKTASSAGRNPGERKEKKEKEAAEEIPVGEIAPEELAGAEELLEAVIPDERKEEAIIIEEKPPTSGKVTGMGGDSGKHLKTTAEIVEFVLYSVWVSALLCGLFWMLFSLIFEHAVVYCKNKKGKYEKIGRCAIFRKKEYKQVNLSRLMTREEGKEYQLRFSRAFALLHKKKKVLIRTWNGVELRNIERKIEI